MPVCTADGSSHRRVCPRGGFAKGWPARQGSACPGMAGGISDPGGPPGGPAGPGGPPGPAAPGAPGGPAAPAAPAGPAGPPAPGGPAGPGDPGGGGVPPSRMSSHTRAKRIKPSSAAMTIRMVIGCIRDANVVANGAGRARPREERAASNLMPRPDGAN